jgi:hypothetical protein
MINYLNSDNEMRRIKEEEKAFFQMRKESIDFVTTELNLQSEPVPDLKEFFLVNTLREPLVKESFCSLNPLLPIQMCIIQYLSEVQIGKVRKSGRESYFFALLTLKKEYPHTLIYPETVSEKIAEIFIKSELDFKDQKKFSRKFYTLTKDKEKLFDLLYNKPLNDLIIYKNMEVEINKNLCLLRHSRKPISKTEAISFCELAKKINRIFN